MSPSCSSLMTSAPPQSGGPIGGQTSTTLSGPVVLKPNWTRTCSRAEPSGAFQNPTMTGPWLIGPIEEQIIPEHDSHGHHSRKLSLKDVFFSLSDIFTPSIWAFRAVRVLRRSAGATTGGWCMSLQTWACCICWPPSWRALHSWCCSSALLSKHTSCRLCKVESSWCIKGVFTSTKPSRRVLMTTPGNLWTSQTVFTYVVCGCSQHVPQTSVEGLIHSFIQVIVIQALISVSSWRWFGSWRGFTSSPGFFSSQQFRSDLGCASNSPLKWYLFCCAQSNRLLLLWAEIFSVV